MRESPWRAAHELDRRVTAFAAVARCQSKNLLIAVFDADAQSAEVSAKWRTRRERELKSEQRNFVLGTDTMFSDALSEQGIPVVRLLGADADDVLASLSLHRPNGCVLSCDSDFWRYEPPVRIFNGWRVNASGTLALWSKQQQRPPAEASHRAVDPHLAELALASLDAAAGAASSPAIRDKYDAAARGGRITRGVSSSSDRRRGNLHALAAPLRAAVYAALGVTGAVHETIPEWEAEAGEVAWRETELAPDAALLPLLMDATAAAAWLDERDGDDMGAFPFEDGLAPWPPGEMEWRAQERRFNRRVLACEMATVAACADSGGAAGVGSVLARMRAFPEYVAAQTS